jgi:hypothetical protein
MIAAAPTIREYRRRNRHRYQTPMHVKNLRSPFGGIRAVFDGLGRPAWSKTCAVLLCATVFPAALHAQVAGDDQMQALLKRIDELEAKAKKVDALESEITALKATRTYPAQSEVPAAPTPVEKWPRLEVHVLGDLDFHLSSTKDEAKQFELGDVDIVTTARLNENAGIVNDLVVSSNHDGFAIEVERLVASYKFNDSLNLDVGRFHTAIGWYNNFYHNGVYFQTTVDRPEPFVFEDNGGILPVHSVGFSLNGEIPSGAANLSYSFEVANGRNFSADSVQKLSVEDDNNYKSLNFQLRAKPDGLAGWQFGAGVYHDTLTPEVAPGVKPRVDETILSGYGVYKTSSFEWFTEAFGLGDAARHEHRHWTGAAYTQVSEKFGQFRPYVRLQWRGAAANDPVLKLMGENTSVWGPQIGVRYDFTSMMAAKFEIERNKFQDGPNVDEFNTQLAFRF